MNQPNRDEANDVLVQLLISRRRFLQLGAGAVAFGLGGVACGEDSPVATGTGETTAADPTATVSWATDEPAGTLDTAIAADIGGLVGIAHVFEALMAVNAEGGADPVLIEGPPEGTGTERAVVLRDGLSFHDGTPVTAADVVFTFERHMNPDTGSLLGPGVAVIERVRAEGDNRVIFSLRQDSDYFPITLALIKIMSSRAFREQGAEAFARNPVGSGPFRMTSFTPQVRYELARFDDYLGEAPRIAGVRAVGAADPASRVSRIRSEEFHVIDHVPIADMDALGEAPGIEVGHTLGSAQINMEFEHGKRPFNDVRVRQAFMHAIDRDAVSQVVFNGLARPAYSMLAEDNPYFVDPTIKLEYDPERASSLLRQAGYADGVEFELLVKSDTGFVPPSAQVVQEHLNAVGIRPSLRLVTGGAGYSQVVEGNYQAFLSYYNIGLFTDPVDFYYRFALYGGNREAFYRWNDDAAQRFDQLVDAAYGAPSFEERKAGYAEAQEIVSEVVPGAVPILYVPVVSAWRDNVQGFEPPPNDLSNFRTISVAA